MALFRQKYNKIPDEQLMELIQRKDAIAFEELYNRYSKRLLIYFYRMLGFEEKAQDFLQNIFTKLIENPKTFHSHRRFSNWIFSIATNMCKNEYRYQEVRKDTVRSESIDGFYDKTNCETELTYQLDYDDFKKQLFLEIQQLELDNRNTFLLRFQENFSIKEISQILECSEGTVKSRLFYITRKLAKKLKDFNPLNLEVN